MSARLDKFWIVLRSIETESGGHCIDMFSRSDGSFGIEEFRRDPEDMGKWAGVSYYSKLESASENGALNEARERVA